MEHQGEADSGHEDFPTPSSSCSSSSFTSSSSPSYNSSANDMESQTSEKSYLLMNQSVSGGYTDLSNYQDSCMVARYEGTQSIIRYECSDSSYTITTRSWLSLGWIMAGFLCVILLTSREVDITKAPYGIIGSATNLLITPPLVSPAVKKVACVGDSITYGFGASSGARTL